MIEADAPDSTRAVFGEFDTDDDWLLNVHEFGGAVRRLTGRTLDDDALRHLFRRADIDGDGLVSLPEFEGCLKEL
ncbi:EF-hand domain-containing protein [Streptomyces sp. WAC08241]|uniref:EF-hand domain-containing protein n=1 Tax=Streptomyces sp. WAC08241 TaxID=2487421 RepID=UPI000F79FB77|nr:EF-hand domain-containing protein [Streptomyces sp. WAC08241]RSS46118.1 EF-hand domain-containing protein [Streptomyces sp. WAC08241]